jgi:TolA-binding protein
MKQFLLSAILFGLLFGTSCHSGGSADKANADSARIRAIRNAKPDKDQFKEAVRLAEEKIKASKVFDAQVAAGAIKAYIDYANEFPNDSISADYYFRSAGLATASGNYDQAILFYNTVADKYPTYKYVVEAIYQEAMIYDSDLPGQDPKAKILYEQVIRDYPNHKLAADSKVAIQNLGKSDEELVKEFEKKNRTH